MKDRRRRGRVPLPSNLWTAEEGLEVPLGPELSRAGADGGRVGLPSTRSSTLLGQRLRLGGESDRGNLPQAE